MDRKLEPVTWNRLIACAPFESLALDKQGTGFVTVKQKTSLLSTKTVMEADLEDLPKHSTVWIRGTVVTLGWVKEVFEVDGLKFILVPRDQILLVAKP